ncbi:MAG: Fis family transcriptional regulator [Campylobacterota bacterium]|nr:Fis family transcriptional regulator [Campylobacterota bacterium]
MGVTNFITASDASAEAFKTANLLKLLSVNALIYGERGTGKLTLARYILPTASVIDASNFDELLDALQSSSEVIITHIEQIPNMQTLQQQIAQHNVRVIATASDTYANELIEEIFTIRVYLPSLGERLEDVPELQAEYLNDAIAIFGESSRVELSKIDPDLSENAISIRRQIFFNYLLSNITEEELMRVTEDYLYDRLGSNNDYREYLHLYEVPLIKAGLKRFKSQLQLSEKLGLNRNTLRKKIVENKEYNLDE